MGQVKLSESHMAAGNDVSNCQARPGGGGWRPWWLCAHLLHLLRTLPQCGQLVCEGAVSQRLLRLADLHHLVHDASLSPSSSL